MFDQEYNIDIELLRIEASALEITTDTDNYKANQLLGKVQNALKHVINERDEEIAEVEAKHAPDIQALRELKKLIKDKLERYRTMAKAEIARISAGLKDGSINAGTYVDSNGRMVGLADSVRTDQGLTSRRRLNQPKIVDFSKVPDIYKKPDMKAIRAAIAKGILNIDGVEIAQSETIQIRTP